MTRTCLLWGLLAAAALAEPVTLVETSFETWPERLTARGQYPEGVIVVADGRLQIHDDSDTAYYAAGFDLNLPLPDWYRLQWRQRLPADGYGGLILAAEGEVIHLGIGQAEAADEFLLETGPANADHPYRTSHRLGPRDQWHAFDLTVDGDQVSVAVDGQEVAARQFSGAPVTRFWFWSGQRSVGLTEVDDVRLTAELEPAAGDGLLVAFGEPAALDAWRDRGGVIGGMGQLISDPEPSYHIDFRDNWNWQLVSPLFGLQPHRSYRLALRYRAMNQPMSFELTVASLAAPRPLTSLTSRETRDRWRELSVDFPSGEAATAAGLILRSTGGGGTLTLGSLTITPLAELVDPYTTGYGLIPPTLGSVGRRLGRLVEAEAAATDPLAADIDGDGRWGLARLEEDADRHYFAGRTVLKSDTAGGPPLTLRFADLKPGQYRVVLSDPYRPASIEVEGQRRLVRGGDGEVELGVVTAPVTVVITPAEPEPGNPGPVYVDYVRFLPVHDPTAPLPKAVPPPPAGPSPERISLTVTEPVGVPRDAALVVAGVPLPQGYLPDLTADHPIHDDQGRPLLLAPLARWRDGSVKWLRVAFETTLAAGATEPVTFDPRQPKQTAPRRPLPPAVVGEGLASILAPLPLTGPPSLWLDFGSGPVAVPLDGGQATVEEQSAYRVVRRWERDLAVAGLPALRLVCRADTRWGDGPSLLTVSLINATDRQLQLARADLDLPLGAASGPAQRLLSQPAGLTLDGAPREPRDGWLAAPTGAGVVGVGIRDMARRYPCAVSTDPSAGVVRVELWAGEEPYRFNRGSSLAHHVVLSASAGPLPEAALRGRLAAGLHPPRVLQAAADLCASGAFGPILPAGAEARFDGLEQLIAESFRIICEQRSADGVEDFGGVFQPGGYIAGTQRMWTNMEYDFVHSTLTQYARTGDPAYLERARQAAAHFTDVDLIRWHSDARRIGGSFVHSHSMRVGHHLEGPNFGHGGWPQGPLWVWYLTGDWDVFEGAVGLAEYILKNIPPPAALDRVTPPYAMSEERDAGNAILTLITVYEATGDERYLTAARQVFDYVDRTQEPGLGNWGTTIHEYPPHRGSTFMLVMLYRALAAYHEVAGDPRAGEVMRAHIPWLLGPARDANRRYPHKEWPPTSRSESSFLWYAEGYALAASFADQPERDRLLDQATADLLAIYTTADRGAMLELDLGGEQHQRQLAASGVLGQWHEYALEVDGRQIRYEVNGELAWTGEFSGRAVDQARFWSGMRARGTMWVDWIRVEGAATAGGRRQVVLDHHFATLAPFTPDVRSEAVSVEAADGVLRVIDPDDSYVGASWSLPAPLQSYRITWRQRFEPGMYGGFNLYGGGRELIHVGLGQGQSNAAPFTNPRTFAPAVANLSRLVGTELLLRGAAPGP